MESRDELDVLDTFIVSFVHGKGWPNHVFATVLYDGELVYVAKNSTSHAEDEVLDYIKQSLMNYRRPLPEIKLFLSASPCGLCSEKIINFVYETGLSLKIVFAGLYQIRRPSCVQNPDCHWHLPSDYEHNFNVDRLKKLYRTQGVVLRPFTGQDWLTLKVAMGVHSYNCSSRQTEDFVLWRDFAEVMEIQPAVFFPKPAFPVNPESSRLERPFHWQTARDSSLYESHSRPFMNNFMNMPRQINYPAFHDQVNYQSWDSNTHETYTYPNFRPRDLGHPVPAGHYMNMEYDGDARRSFRFDF